MYSHMRKEEEIGNADSRVCGDEGVHNRILQGHLVCDNFLLQMAMECLFYQ